MKCVALRPLYIDGVNVMPGNVIHLTEARAAELGNAVAMLVGKAEPIIPPEVTEETQPDPAEQPPAAEEAPKGADAEEVHAEGADEEEAPESTPDPAEQPPAAEEAPKGAQRGKGKGK